MLRTEIVESPDWAPGIRDAWRDLAQSDPAATPFQTWEWQSAWYKHFSRGRKPLVWMLHEGKDLIGLMPFLSGVSPWRSLRPMGYGPSDYLQPIARPDQAWRVADSLADFLVERSKKQLIDLHQLRGSLPLAHALLERRIAGQGQAMCLVLDLQGSFDDYLKTLGKSLRYDVKRLEKTPFSDGKAKIVRVEEGKTREGVDFFLDAHRKRWSKRGLPGAFLGKKIQEFHREWAELAVREGWLWMSMLELDGAPIGAIYAMRFGPTCYFYQSGFDPAKSSLSPGSLLVASTIRRAIEEGLEHFDFLRGDEPYKRRWKPQREEPNMRYLFGESAVAKVGEAWNQAAFRMETKIRSRFEGKSLRG